MVTDLALCAELLLCILEVHTWEPVAGGGWKTGYGMRVMVLG